MKAKKLWTNDELIRYFSNSRIEEINRLLIIPPHILCLTDDFNNQYMWDNYSENETGFCIGYRTVGKGENFLLPIYLADLKGLKDFSDDFQLKNENDKLFRRLLLEKVSYDRKI